MGQKWHPISLLAEKNGMVLVLAAKNSTLLPKMELLFILANRQKRTPHGASLAAKYTQLAYL